MMSLSQRVLDYVHTEDGMAFFSQPPEDMEPGMETTLSLPEQDYIDFGSPSQITIGIIPGDILNAVRPTPEQAAAAGLRLDVEKPILGPGSVGD